MASMRGPSKINVVIGAQIEALTLGLRKAQAQVNGFTKSTQRAFNETAAASKKSFKNITSNAVWQQSAIAAAGIGTVLFKNVQAAVEFESVMADVRKVVDFPTPKAFRQMNSDIIALSKSIPMSASGLAEIVAAAGQAGIARHELTDFAKTASKMAIAFDMTASEAGESMAKMRTAMGLSQDEVESLADAMNHLSNNMASTAPQITNFMLRVGADAKQFAFAETEVAAFGSAMIAAGAAPEVAATSFRNLTKALSSGEIATKRQRDAFAALGLDAVKVSQMMQDDATGTIQKVFSLLQDVDPAKRASLTKALFGSEARALAPLLTNTKLLSSALDEVADSKIFKGSMLKEFEARSKTTANQMQLFRNNLKALAIVLGSTVLPVINSFLKFLTPIIASFSWLIEKVPILGVAFMTLSSIFVSIVALFPIVAGGIILLNQSLIQFKALAAAGLFSKFGTAAMLMGKKVVAGAVMASGAIWKVTMAMLANPLFWKIAIIAGAVAGGIFLIKKAFEGLTNIVGGTFNILKSVGGFFMNFISGVIFGAKRLLEVVTFVFGAIRKLLPFSNAQEGPFANLTENGFSLMSTIAEGVQNAAGLLLNTFKNAFTAPFRFLGGLVGAGIGFGADIIKGVADGISAAANTVKDAFAKATAFVKKGIGDTWNATVDFFNPFDNNKENPSVTDNVADGPQGMTLQTPVPGVAGATTENIQNSTGGTTINAPLTITISEPNASAEEIAIEVEKAFNNIIGEANSGQRALLSD